MLSEGLTFSERNDWHFRYVERDSQRVREGPDKFGNKTILWIEIQCNCTYLN